MPLNSLANIVARLCSAHGLFDPKQSVFFEQTFFTCASKQKCKRVRNMP